MPSRILTPPQEEDEKIRKASMNRNCNESSGLVIIDVQNEFISTNGNFPISETCRPSLLANLRHLIPRFRKSGGHIIWVQAIYENRTEEPAYMKAQQKGDGIVGNNEWLTAATHVYHIPCCEARTWGAEMYPEVFALAEPKDSFVTKGGYSAFNRTTALLDTLREKNVKNAYFCGVASGTCVLATILDTVKLGEVRVHAVPDCMGYRRYNTHEEALRRMKELNVVLVDSHQFGVLP